MQKQHVALWLLVLLAFVTPTFGQAVDVPTDVILPVKFDLSPADGDSLPQTVSLPRVFEHQVTVNRIEALIRAGESRVAAHRLATLLQKHVDEDTVIEGRFGPIGFRRRLIQLLMSLPEESIAVSVAQFEAVAASQLAQLVESSDADLVGFANRYPATKSARSALLIQATREFDLGHRANARGLLQTLKDRGGDLDSTGSLQRLSHACEFCSTPLHPQSPKPKPQPWTASLVADVADAQDQHDQVQARIERRLAVFPARHPVVGSDSIAVRAEGCVLVFSAETGNVKFDIPLSVGRRDEFADQDCGALMAISDGRLLIVEGYESDRMKPPSRFGHGMLRLEPQVFPIWPPGEYMNTPVPVTSSKLVAYDLETGDACWSAGSLTEDNPALRDAKICGRPVIDGQQIFVIAEAGQTVRLVVLDASDGQVQWAQQFGWAGVAIDEDPDRCGCDCCPVVGHDLILCPTMSGKLVAVNRHTRSLQWAFNYKTLAQLPQQNHLIEAPDFEPRRWFGRQSCFVGDRIIVTAADSNELICLDRPTGQRLCGNLVKETGYVIHHDAESVWVVGLQQVQRLSLIDGCVLATMPLPSHATVTGLGVAMAGELILPACDRLLKIDISAQSLAQQIPIRSGQTAGNLAQVGDLVVDGGLTGCSVRAIENSVVGVR